MQSNLRNKINEQKKRKILVQIEISRIRYNSSVGINRIYIPAIKGVINKKNNINVM